jgi:hypothetical protein
MRPCPPLNHHPLTPNKVLAAATSCGRLGNGEPAGLWLSELDEACSGLQLRAKSRVTPTTPALLTHCLHTPRPASHRVAHPCVHPIDRCSVARHAPCSGWLGWSVCSALR